MNRLIGFGLGLASILFAVFVILFLGGLASAWLEVRNERRAGLEPTRPGWDARDKLAARRRFYTARMGTSGGRFFSVVLWWRGLRMGTPQCWCGFGPLAQYERESDLIGAGWGCVAVENAHPLALMCHDEAGTYDRSPIRPTRTRVGRAA